MLQGSVPSRVQDLEVGVLKDGASGIGLRVQDSGFGIYVLAALAASVFTGEPRYYIMTRYSRTCIPPTSEP